MKIRRARKRTCSVLVGWGDAKMREPVTCPSEATHLEEVYKLDVCASHAKEIATTKSLTLVQDESLLVGIGKGSRFSKIE